MATTDTTVETLEAYRVAQIEELGFDHDQAESLSQAYYDTTLVQKGVTTTYKLRMDHHYLRKLLDAGASHEQILRICL